MGSRRTHEAAAVAAARATYLAGFARHVEPGGRPPLRHPDGGHRRARLRAPARRRARRVPRARSRRLGHGARRCSSTPTTSARASRTRSRAAGPELGADPHRLGRPRRAGPPGPRAARRARRDRHPDRAVRRPRRVRDRRAARRARRLLRRGHVGGHRLGGADREPGLQAGGGRRAAGGQAERGEGVARRGASRRCAGTSRRARRSRRSCTAGHAARGRPARPRRCRCR